MIPIASMNSTTGLRCIRSGSDPESVDFADNAIDGPGDDGDEPQPEGLNRIPAAEFGILQDFGCYIQYRTGAPIGSGCKLPLAAFQPLPSGTALGAESEVRLR